MTKKQAKPLSKAAEKLLDRVRNPDNWYRVPNFGDEGPAMLELLDAGLVVSKGRVNGVILCFVPKGTKAFRLETYPEHECRHLEIGTHECETDKGICLRKRCKVCYRDFGEVPGTVTPPPLPKLIQSSVRKFGVKPQS